jgi:hypothetical protein
VTVRQVLDEDGVPNFGGAGPGWVSWTGDGNVLLWRDETNDNFGALWGATACLYDDATRVIGNGQAHSGPWRSTVGAVVLTSGEFGAGGTESSNLSAVTLAPSRPVPARCAPEVVAVVQDPPPVAPSDPQFPAPTVVTAQGELRIGSTVLPLAPSTPGSNQVRYAAEGITVTFTGAPGTSATNGLVANPNGTVLCEVCAPLAVDDVIEAWLYSTPRLIAAHRVDGRECQVFEIPFGAPLDGLGPVTPGLHALQLRLPTATGVTLVDVGITVGPLRPTRLPAGEGPLGGLLSVASLLTLLLTGLLAVRLGRRPSSGRRSDMTVAG